MTKGSRSIDNHAYSRLLFGVEQGDPEAIALYAPCESGNGDADAIEAWASRKPA